MEDRMVDDLEKMVDCGVTCMGDRVMADTMKEIAAVSTELEGIARDQKNLSIDGEKSVEM